MESIREMQKAEAIEWLKLLRVPQNVREAFEADGSIRLCEGPQGIYRTLTDAEVEQVKAFEDGSGYMVYLVIRAVMAYGVFDLYCSVCIEPEVSTFARSKIPSNNYVYAFCFNQDHPESNYYREVFITYTKNGGIACDDIDFS